MNIDLKMPARRPRDISGYYGLPAVKPPHWDWTVSSYIFLAGLAGSSQIIALIGQVTDKNRYRDMIRNARILATTASGLGAALLVFDLKTPRRWFNMLRILRPRSPMSFGSYILSGFMAISGMATVADLLGRRAGRLGSLARRVADKLQIGAAITGAGASTYTAALLAATSNPEWASQPGKLGRGFAASSVASAAAALGALERLQGRLQNAGRLESLAAIATIVHLANSLLSGREPKAERILSAAHRKARAKQKFAERILGGALPLLLYGIGRIGPAKVSHAPLLASGCIIAGGFLMRHALLQSGKTSTQTPAAYLGFTSGWKS